VAAFAGATRSRLVRRRMLDYAVLIKPLLDEDGGGFLATVPDLPGSMSDGDTREAAARNFEDAIACWLEEAKAIGRAIPEPKPALRIALSRRIPHALHISHAAPRGSIAASSALSRSAST